MSENTKKYALIVVASVAAILTVVTQCINNEGTPVPAPSASGVAVPSPSPTPTTTASPSPSPSPVPGALHLTGSRNEVVGAPIQAEVAAGCQSLGLTIPGVTAKFYEMRQITTTQPSATDLTPGKVTAPLIPITAACAPMTRIWMDVLIPKTLAPGAYAGSVTMGGVGKLSVTLKVWKLTMPDNPTIPLYAEVHSQGILDAHGLRSANTDTQGPLTKAFVDVARAHRIEPYKQWVNFRLPLKPDGSLDVDQYGANASPRTLGLTGAIAPVMIPTFYGKEPTDFPTDAYLQGIQKTITALGLTGAWTYLWDEPSEADMPEIKRRASKIRQFVPGLRIMVTTEERDDLLGLVDILAPVLDHFKITGHRAVYRPGYWLYTSCMEHSCGNVGPSSGVPGLVVDRPLVHGRAFLHVVAQQGGKAGLYYNLTEAYQRQDLWANPWVLGPNGLPFGGNYDGVLLLPSMQGSPKALVPGLSAPGPVETLMLKYIRQGSYDQDYLRLAELSDAAWAAGLRARLVTSQFVWSKDLSAYDAVRNEIGERLGAP